MRIFDRMPLDIAEVHIPRGQVYLIPERCKGCELCVQFCPQGVLVTSAEMNAKGYHYPTILPDKENACINCEFCALICPEFAIFSLPNDRGSGD